MNRSPVPADPVDHKALENYRFQGTIGEGNFAKVKLATHYPTLEKVAVKIIDRTRLLTVAENIRLSREISIMKKADHPHIVRLLEVGDMQAVKTSHKVYLVMEYASGGDLMSHILSHNRLSEDVSRAFMQQLVSGVGYLHGLGVSHRDLKPANILLTSAGEVKIADFGLSNSFGSEGLLETRCGSPCFIAPEMIASQLYDGRLVDVWSLGVVLYLMLVGQVPFSDENRTRMFRKICAGRFTVPKTVSREARDLIQKMLVVDPKDRITLRDVQSHPWLQYPGCCQSPREDSPINTFALAEAQRLGFSPKHVTEELRNGVKNSATATYHLLTRKLQRIEATTDLLKVSTLQATLKRKTLDAKKQSPSFSQSRSPMKVIERKNTTPGRHLTPLSPRLANFHVTKATAPRAADATRLRTMRLRTVHNSTLRSKSPL